MIRFGAAAVGVGVAAWAAPWSCLAMLLTVALCCRFFGYGDRLFLLFFFPSHSSLPHVTYIYFTISFPDISFSICSIDVKKGLLIMRALRL